jgi:hypothetical protein
MTSQDLAINELQTRSLALAEVASELIRGVSGPADEDPLPSREELLDIALSLLMVDPSQGVGLPPEFPRPSPTGRLHGASVRRAPGA